MLVSLVRCKANPVHSPGPIRSAEATIFPLEVSPAPVDIVSCDLGAKGLQQVLDLDVIEPGINTLFGPRCHHYQVAEGAVCPYALVYFFFPLV